MIKNDQKILNDRFNNAKELLTEILLQSCTKLLKSGLNRGYINIEEKLEHDLTGLDR